MSPPRLRIVERLESIDSVAWNALVEPDNPFCDHAFLTALERSGSVGARPSGWVSHHVTLWEQERLVAAAPAYLKYDSYGEFIFDWAWARGAMQAGIPYYPKLLVVVPFTPATGNRLLVRRDAAAPLRRAQLLQALRDAATAAQASGVHVLFCTKAEQDAADLPFAARRSFQFHWHNDAGWADFDAWLKDLRAPSRKQVKRERRIAQSHGLRLSVRQGGELEPQDCAALYRFYRRTIDEKGALAYLNEAFFAELRQSLRHLCLAIMAYDDDVPVAGALYFHKGHRLFGRYWGCSRSYDALHFELCYYAPIAWCLQNGMSHFEAGAQGEHKVKRGLLPRPCHSVHWLAHAGLMRAVAQYVTHEAHAVKDEIAWFSQASPYRRDATNPSA